MTVRPVNPEDIDILTEFWYDQMALRSQKQRSIRLSATASQDWKAYAHNLLTDTEVLFLAVEIEAEVTGCVIARQQDNRTGLVPAKIGFIEELILDLHSPHKRKNSVSMLLEAVKDHFRQLQIQHIIVHVPTYSPVEQGFWRGLGLIHLEDTFWMDLSK